MATTSGNPPWKLEKEVVVSTSNFDAHCVAHLRMAHKEAAKQGSITLSIKADLANVSPELQVLKLIVPPERIGESALKWNSNDDFLPSRVVEAHPAQPKKKSEVLTLTLKLNLTGIVLCPSETETLTPATPGDLGFQSFAKICRSTSFCLHFSKRQFAKDQLGWLEIFTSALRAKCLRSESLDHSRHRVVEKDWRVFSLSPKPPPYEEEPPRYYGNVVSEQVVGKRCTESRSRSPIDERRKRLLLATPSPIGSPTEANTQSSPPLSTASIRPTYFTRAFSPCSKRGTLARLENELRGLSSDLVREILVRSGHQHLLATPDHVDCELPSEFEKTSFAEKEIIDRLERYVEEMMEHRIIPHVDEVVSTAVSDQIENEYKTKEAELDEHFEEAKCDLRITANEYMDEIGEQAQKHMKEIEDKRIEIGMPAKKGGGSNRWFNTSARSLLDRKSTTGLDADPNFRRSSI
ncbi:hypothetical protein HFD88_002239 [Aspergillus terreus]|nr:hypothetical protein HFD88_002239 [Aspergillus terreus]